MPGQTKLRYTPEEYLLLEREAEHKSEYFDGEIFAMSGASERHNLIVTNLVRELSLQLKGRACKTYSNDMRVKVTSTGLYTYPNVIVLGGKAVFDDEQEDTLLNPTVIVEVLSKSTGGYDKGEKFAHYRKLESLADYLLVSQGKYHVEHYFRQRDSQWLLSETENLKSAFPISSINCVLSMAEIYDKVGITPA
jgi:Uma2 family endonuclease